MKNYPISFSADPKMSEFKWTQEKIDEFFKSEKGIAYKDLIKKSYDENWEYKKVMEELRKLNKKFK